jgi:hypothetical protein
MASASSSLWKGCTQLGLPTGLVEYFRLVERRPGVTRPSPKKEELKVHRDINSWATYVESKVIGGDLRGVIEKIVSSDVTGGDDVRCLLLDAVANHENEEVENIEGTGAIPSWTSNLI